VTASHDGSARVWDAINGRQLTEVKHSGRVWSARFSSDGTRIVTASHDGTARVWDAQTGQPLTPALRHDAPVMSAEFSPDGKRIITASLDQSARVWDANSGLPLIAPLRRGGPVRDAQFSPNGQRVVVVSDDGTAVTWDIGPSGAAAPKWMLALTETISGQVLNTQGVLEPQKSQQARTIGQILDELNQTPGDNSWAEWGRWFLADPATRTISPYSKITIADFVENRLKENTVE